MSIYLDHNATSPMHAPVIDAMLPFLQNPVGHPSSLHSCGRRARSAVETARAEVAEMLGCESASVIFTSRGAENVAGIVGLGKAAQLARLEMAQRRLHLEQSRDLFESRLKQIPWLGELVDRLPSVMRRAAV